MPAGQPCRWRSSAAPVPGESGPEPTAAAAGRRGAGGWIKHLEGYAVPAPALPGNATPSPEPDALRFATDQLGDRQGLAELDTGVIRKGFPCHTDDDIAHLQVAILRNS